MQPVSGLDTLLQQLEPSIHAGEFTFCTVPAGSEIPAQTIAWIAEAEGVSVILPVEVAEHRGFPFTYRAAWITLKVHSDLAAVGLSAAVTTVLAHAGISCNLVAGFHHDHLFVPFERGEEALKLLQALSKSTV